MTLTNPQLMMLRCLINRGWAADLIEWLPSRCGAGTGEWEALVSGGLTELVGERPGRFELTEAGRKEYRRQRVGRYF